MEPDIYHIPVLLRPSLEGLNIKRDGTYVDVTLGGGGHSRALLAQLGKGGHLYSFDQDADAIAQCERLRETEKSTEAEWTLVRSNFRYLHNWMRYYGVEGVDGILADLGVSSHHLDDAGRGFSFRADGATSGLKTGGSYRQGTRRSTDRDHIPAGAGAHASRGARSGKERSGPRLSGFTH